MPQQLKRKLDELRAKLEAETDEMKRCRLRREIAMTEATERVRIRVSSFP